MLPESATLKLSPNHLVDDAGVGLEDLHDLGGDAFVHVIRN